LLLLPLAVLVHRQQTNLLPLVGLTGQSSGLLLLAGLTGQSSDLLLMVDLLNRQPALLRYLHYRELSVSLPWCLTSAGLFVRVLQQCSPFRPLLPGPFL
jgi:hypothetical protein